MRGIETIVMGYNLSDLPDCSDTTAIYRLELEPNPDISGIGVSYLFE